MQDDLCVAWMEGLYKLWEFLTDPNQLKRAVGACQAVAKPRFHIPLDGDLRNARQLW